MNWDISGHEWAVQLLQQHIGSQQTRHAYLFSGVEGIGKRTLALKFAQAFNCPQPPHPGEACGQCRTCRQIEKMQYSDLMVVQAENEGGILKIDQVRDLQRSMSLTPFEGRYRIALLLRFHEANDNAQNALLKLLEEPPSRAVLLLTAAAPETLLPTIVSRCEVLRLRPQPVEVLSTQLQEHWSINGDEARKLAHLSGGRVGYALRLHEEPQRLEVRQRWLEDLFSLLVSSRRSRMAYAEQFKREGKERLRQALLNWLPVWRDLLLLASRAEVPLTDIENSTRLQPFAEQMGLSETRRVLNDLENGLEKLDNSNVNAQMLAEILLLDWPIIHLISSNN